MISFDSIASNALSIEPNFGDKMHINDYTGPDRAGRNRLL